MTQYDLIPVTIISDTTKVCYINEILHNIKNFENFFGSSVDECFWLQKLMVSFKVVFPYHFTSYFEGGEGDCNE